MAIWQMTKYGEPTLDQLYDDGGQVTPGDDTFSTAAVQAHLATLGAEADGFNYVGQSPTP